MAEPIGVFRDHLDRTPPDDVELRQRLWATVARVVPYPGLLGSQYDALTDALLDEVRQVVEDRVVAVVAEREDTARAVAWQEGWEAGDADATAHARERQVGNSTDHLELTANPYLPGGPS